VQDVLPTLARIAGAGLRPDQLLDGSDRWGAITGDGSPAATDFVAVSLGDHAVLSGDWKLVVSGGNRELYNLAEDPREQTDLSADNPAVVERLQAAIDRIPREESINEPWYEIVMDPDAFGGEEDRPPWADVVRQAH
jgi:arylsulfatase A-like enzyme